MTRLPRSRVAARAVAVALVAGFLAAPARGASPLDEREAFERSQAVIGSPLRDQALLASDGRRVRLSQYRGRPLVVSLVYTSCYHTCPILTRRLAAVVDVAREALGEESFSVVTIGFDTPHDTPDRMRAFASAQGVRDPRWDFLSADAATMEGLVEDLGFVYAASPRGFDHLAQTTVVDGQGRVYRQIYGDAIDAPALVEPLKEIVFEAGATRRSVAGWIDGLRLLCTVYDPASGRYGFDYSVFVMAATGIACLGGIAFFLVRAWREHQPPTRSA